ncbi:MAG: DUF3501 family protein [Pseudomonadales bacterium]|nr:DUF3501 family protein [Pseudomonadales bacterium]MBO6596149.1 DUF3501 family protein [Pseudomonadales bacterium]MBO6822629.1 DUF3501 family protein [Pseudomonadales bacterium]
MLERKDLWSLEQYAEHRPDFRAQVLAHKENRRVQMGKHVLLVFEDALTIKYQIQEMLRIEKVFEAAGIQEELDAYNPLIPDGDNWKCSMLIQYPDVEERKERLAKLIDIENKVWVKVGETEKVFAIADEDLERANDEKTSAVHFLRFQFEQAQVEALKAGESITFGIDHDNYDVGELIVSDEVRAALAADIT